MVGESGAVKVLDFGLAKLVARRFERPTMETVTQGVAAGLSVPGAIMGTAAYMAPEQATGGKVDARSDIFSFGAMLYEMATGTRAFAGSSVADTLAAVIRDQPTPPTQIAAGVPRELERLILRCLRKEPDAALSVDARCEERAAGDQGRIAPRPPSQQRLQYACVSIEASWSPLQRRRWSSSPQPPGTSGKALCPSCRRCASCHSRA